MTAIVKDEVIDGRISKILTQYRESPKLIHMLKTYMGQIVDPYQGISDLPELMDIDFAVGDQLTLLGKRLGWLRCHCVCDYQPVFGFECDDQVSQLPVEGFCNDLTTWIACEDTGIGEVCISDDELYRKFLKVRLYQISNRYYMNDLTQCLNIMWGDTSRVIYSGRKQLIVSPGRDLTNDEISLLQLYPRILPVALGVQVLFHFGEPELFGFGDGWGGFCDQGFPDGVDIVTESGEILVTEDPENIITGPLLDGANWLCPIDVKPWSC